MTTHPPTHLDGLNDCSERQSGGIVIKPYEADDAQRDDGSVSAADLISDYERGAGGLRASVSGLTLRQLLLHPINHLAHHLRFVAEKRAALGAGKP